jgi:RNA polymerase sigma-B factor
LQPRSRDPVVTSLSDADGPEAGMTHPDALPVRLGGAAPCEAGRVAVRARGLEFASYAILTSRGVVKRSFRDTAWNVRVPRRLAELKLQLTTITEDPAHVSHRSPTTAELAARLGVSRDVLTARHCAYAYRPLTFRRPASGIEDLRPIDSLGGPDFGIKAFDKRETIRLRLAELPERKRRIITLRCIAGMTQAKIAAEIGGSQMQISPAAGLTLTRLRDGMLADTGSAAVEAGPAGVVR